MNYNFFVFKFLLFVVINFLFIFQGFFSLNFFFSSKIDEELIICLAIFFVFILFINHIVTGLQDMLKSRSEIYINVFLLIFKLLRKSLKRLKKHNHKTVAARSFAFSFLWNAFYTNLASYSTYQNSLNNYLIHLRLKTVLDVIIADSELRLLLKKRSLLNAFFDELKYFSLLRSFSIS